MNVAEIQKELRVLLPQGGAVGLVGYGNFGQMIAEAVRKEGMELRVCDPLRAAEESAEEFEEICTLWGNGMGGCTYQSSSEPVYLPLSGILKNSDLLILAVPLTKDGPCPTAGMISCSSLRQIRPSAKIWNLSDPGVIVP